MTLEWEHRGEDADANHKGIEYSVEQGSGPNSYWAFIGSQLAGIYKSKNKAMARCQALAEGKAK